MGSVTHPLGDQARGAIAERDFNRAASLLDQGLLEDPGHPDLACEAAILAMYRADEEQAFELLPISAKGQRFDRLTSLLADHYTSRILLDRHDQEARVHLQLVRTFHPKESKHIGVKICACLIVKDEEKTLARCLTSLQGKVDQIVVVDTGSSDATLSIARQFGARTAEFVWDNDFSAARNYALSFATANWVLCIDADEELTPETKAAFERAVIRPQFGGFEIDIVNFLNDSNDRDQFRHSPTRFFRNIPGVKYSGRIHEQVNPSLALLGLPWSRLDGATILHHGYKPQVMQEKSKIERTISLLERETFDDPNNRFQTFNLANAYLIAGRYEEAAKAAESATRSLTSRTGFAVPAFSILIQALHGLGRFDEALEFAREAADLGFDCLQIEFERCRVLVSAGRYHEAVICSERMMDLEWADGSTGDLGILTHKRHVLRAQVLSRLGMNAEALRLLEYATTVAPGYGPAHFVMSQVLDALGRAEAAIDSLRSAATDPSCASAAHRELARIYEREGRLDEAGEEHYLLWKQDTSDVGSWAEWKRCCEVSLNPVLLLQCFEQFAAAQPVTAAFYVDWGRVWAAVGKHQQAMKCFAEAMRLDPSDANAYFNGGDVLYLTGSVAGAIELYKAGLSLRPDWADGWFVYGNALARAGQEGEASQALERALELVPGHEKARYNLEVLRAA